MIDFPIDTSRFDPGVPPAVPGTQLRGAPCAGLADGGRWSAGYPALRRTVWPSRWSSSAACAHAVEVSVLTRPRS